MNTENVARLDTLEHSLVKEDVHRLRWTVSNYWVHAVILILSLSVVINHPASAFANPKLQQTILCLDEGRLPPVIFAMRHAGISHDEALRKFNADISDAMKALDSAVHDKMSRKTAKLLKQDLQQSIDRYRAVISEVYDLPPFDTVALEKAALERVKRGLFEACMSDTPAEEIDGWIELRCEELVDYIRPFIKLRSMNISRQIAFDRLARHKKQSRAELNSVKRELTRRLNLSDEWKARWETDYIANWETEWQLMINTVSKAYDVVPAYSVMAKRDELLAEFRYACTDQIMP